MIVARDSWIIQARSDNLFLPTPMFKPILALLLLALASSANGENATVAAASNFDAALREIGRAFEGLSQHEITIVTGASGKLFAQVMHGAPFDVFLSADQLRPARLVEQGIAEQASQFTYALGRLTLWSLDEGAVKTSPGGQPNLERLRTIAIANPELAPYGLAARETIQRLDQWQEASRKIVMGENVGQVYAMVATGNAHGGFVASSALRQTNNASGSRWQVPSRLHDAIRQDAVLLNHGADNAAARAFMAFLDGPAARSLIQAHGYNLD